jgi:hypothetical protein
MREFLPPTALQGTDAGKIANLYSYLHQMSRQLNVALQNIGPENFSDTDLKTLVSNPTAVQTATQAASGYSELKSLIVKTADNVTVAMDTLREYFEGTYVANSTFGTFEQGLQLLIETTAAGVVQNYSFSETITLLDQLLAVTNYQLSSNQYIKTGLLYFENIGGVDIPRYGVAVGEDLTTMSVTVGGVVYNVVNRAKLMVTHTSDALTFWNNDVKVAWVSNNQLYINEINLVSKMVLGVASSPKWQMDYVNGFTVKWVGA